ncbi:unnamed protein product [Peniophora sp. CBMAI 1063]|nr:unnamed protein product [Peniophora sp. CBMAI 1063]
MGRNRTRPARADPSKPPRPRNAWMLFLCAYHQERTRKQEMNLPLENETHQHTKIISQMWKALPQEERDKWVMAAEREKEEHARLYPGYKYQPSKPPGRKASTASASPPPAVPPQSSSSAHPSVTKARSNSSAAKPKETVLGQTPMQWDVPQAAKKARMRQEYDQVKQPNSQRQSQTPPYAPAPQHYAQHSAPKARRGRPPKAKQEVIEEDIENIELVDGQLVPKAGGSAAANEDSDEDMLYESEDEDHAGSAHGHQYGHPGYAYDQAPEDSESEDEASSQVSPSTPTQQDNPAAPVASSKPTATDAQFPLRHASYEQ